MAKRINLDAALAPKALPRDFVPNGTRKIRAGRPDGVGLLTKGNANSGYLGRTITPGLLAKVGTTKTENLSEDGEPTIYDVEKSAACPACGLIRAKKGVNRRTRLMEYRECVECYDDFRARF